MPDARAGAGHRPVGGVVEDDAPAASLRWSLPTAAVTRALGVTLGRMLRAGDLLVLTGGLGAGKTTLTQGLGEGLGVRGPITSPTFVIARVHPSLVGGPPLVHVDAYRLGGGLELDDLDLDASLEDSVTVVEWGHGVAELLSGDRLELVLETAPASVGDDLPVEAGGTGDTREAVTTGLDPRVVSDPDEAGAGERRATLTPTGPRWRGPEAAAALATLGPGTGIA